VTLAGDKHPSLIRMVSHTKISGERASAPGKDARLKTRASASRERSWSDPPRINLSPAKHQGLDLCPLAFGQPAGTHKLGAWSPETCSVVKGQKSVPSGAGLRP